MERPKPTASESGKHGQNGTSSLTAPEVIEVLQSGRMEVKGLLPWSSNYTFLAEIDRGSMVVPAVYKPRKGERPLWDFPQGSLYRREMAAFIVSNVLGWHLVPPTVMRSGEHGVGVVQFFIDHDPEENFFTFRDPWPEALTRIALFDVIINNADRKGGHCLRDRQNRIWAIDHGICFHEENKLRTVIWEMAGQAIPEKLLSDLRTFDALLEANAAPIEALSELLSPSEILALRQRLQNLLELKRFPLPPPNRRHVPWPMV